MSFRSFRIFYRAWKIYVCIAIFWKNNMYIAWQWKKGNQQRKAAILERRILLFLHVNNEITLQPIDKTFYFVDLHVLGQNIFSYLIGGLGTKKELFW